MKKGYEMNQAFVDTIVNGGMNEEPTVKKMKVLPVPTVIPERPIESIPQKLIPEIVPPSVQSPLSLSEPSELSDYCDTDEEDEGSDDNYSINDLPPPDKVKFLPETSEGLEKRFNELFCEFWRERKLKHRNELVVILDELLNHDAITLETYKKLNSLLARSLGSGISTEDVKKEEIDGDMEVDTSVQEEEEEEQKSIKKKIVETIDYLITHDKK